MTDSACAAAVGLIEPRADLAVEQFKELGRGLAAWLETERDCCAVDVDRDALESLLMGEPPPPAILAHQRKWEAYCRAQGLPEASAELRREWREAYLWRADGDKARAKRLAADRCVLIRVRRGVHRLTLADHLRRFIPPGLTADIFIDLRPPRQDE